MPLPDFTAGTVLTAAALDAAFATPFPVGIDAWTPFTPTLTQGATPTTTVNYAAYTRVGNWITANYALAVTGAGTAANVILVGLPVPAVGATFLPLGHGAVFDSSAGLMYSGTVILNTGTTGKITSYNAANYLGAGGMTAALASGDLIAVSLNYEAS